MHSDAITALRRDGFAAVVSFMESETLSRLQQAASDLVQAFTLHGHRSEDYWSFERPGFDVPVLYRIHNLDRQGASSIAELFANGPLHDLAAAILGTPVRSTACAMIVKLPYVAAAVPWHRDRTSVPPQTVCNLSVFLDRSTNNGCLEFVAGSHLLPDDADVQATQQRGPRQPVPAEAGDVLVHDVRVVHGSRSNETAAIRRSIVIEFAPVDLRLPVDG